MNLENVLEENSTESISKKTNISADNLKRLFERDFSAFKKVQALGFISILERDYGLDLSALKQECKDYFIDDEEDVTISVYQAKPKPKGRWLFFVLLLFLLGAVASLMIYDYTVQSKKNGGQMFLTQEMVLGEVNASENIPEDMVANGTISKDEFKEVKDESLAFGDNGSVEASDADQENNSSATASSKIILTPKYKLWFGIYDMTSGKSSHQIIKAPFEFGLDRNLLIATSRAAFSIGAGDTTTGYKDFKEHYFMIKNGKISEIKREEFRALNGPKKW
ncbi:MAG: hypothetical protein P8Y43_06975 [Sulfurovaceae bacterium]